MKSILPIVLALAAEVGIPADDLFILSLNNH
jgi:hypothetical protein